MIRRWWNRRTALVTFGVRSSVPGLSVTLTLHRRGRVTWTAYGGWDTGGPWNEHATGITVDNEGVEWVTVDGRRARRFDDTGRQAVRWDDRARGWVHA